MFRALLLSLLLLAVSAAHAQTPEAHWQYATLVLSEQSGTGSYYAPDGEFSRVPLTNITDELSEIYGADGSSPSNRLAAALDILGDNGWELVAVDGITYIFKRGTPA